MTEAAVQPKSRSFVWGHAMEGLKWGATIGIGLKCLDTLITFLQVDVLTAILFLAAIGVCFIPKIGAGLMIFLAIAFTWFTGVNLFLTVLVAGITGAVLGALPGMAIGGLVGLLRRNAGKAPADTQPESGIVSVTAFILPLIGGVGLLAVYIMVINPWICSLFE
jgi:hypothetical protein